MVVTIVQTLPPDFLNVRLTDVVSVLVTIGLFIVYWRMKNIQDEQNKIQRKQNRLMSRQTDLMAANHKPRLTRNGMWGDGDKVVTSVTNRGNGPAEKLHVQCVVYGQNSNDGEPLFRKGFKREGTAVVPKPNPLTRNLDYLADGGDPTLSANRIEEEDGDVRFESVIKMEPLSMNSSGYEAPFSEVMQRIRREWSTETIAIEFWLLFADVTGNPFALWFGSYTDIELRDGLNIEEAIESGQSGERIGNPVQEGESASVMMLNPDDIDFGS